MSFSKLMRKHPAWFGIIMLTILTPAAVSVSLLLYYDTLGAFGPGNKSNSYNITNQFANMATWVQAYIAWITLIFIGITLSQFLLRQEQLKLQRKTTERELYRPLISNEAQSIKRFLAFPAVIEEFKKLQGRLCVERNLTIEQSEIMLDGLRRSIKHIAGDIELPLLNGNEASLDHIESLVNEYSYLSKLINEKKLDEGFATDSAKDNCKNTFNSSRPLIVLRQKISPSMQVISVITVRVKRNWSHK